MKIIFFGTPDYVLPIVEALHKKFVRLGKSPIVAVVTQKPKPAGRKQIITYSPVDSWAFRRKIPIYHSCEDFLKAEVVADVGVLAAYGEIIPQKAIDVFRYGIVNVHPSLLPKHRGASPVQATLTLGEKETGVTMIKIDNLLDHGPIISRFSEKVLETDNLDSLRARLFERAAVVLAELIEPYIQGKITTEPQNQDKATFTTQVNRKHGLIPPEYLNAALKGSSLKNEWEIPFIKDASFRPSPLTIYNFIRALYPWPGAWTFIRLSPSGQTKRLKILSAHIEAEKLTLDEIQLEGKNPVSWEQFREAYKEATFG